MDKVDPCEIARIHGETGYTFAAFCVVARGGRRVKSWSYGRKPTQILAPQQDRYDSRIGGMGKTAIS